MKLMIEIADEIIDDAMRFTGANNCSAAVVKAVESYNRMQMIKRVVASFESMDYASNDEIESGGMEWSPWRGTSKVP